MNVPRILVVDDQYARDEDSFLTAVGFQADEPYAEFVFCSGQRKETDRIVNDLDVVKKEISDKTWALVLVDVQFFSGKLDENERPGGQVGDEFFGIIIKNYLEKYFPDIPLLMLTDKAQYDTGTKGKNYLSKTSLTSYEFKKKLYQFGNINTDTRRVLLEIDKFECSGNVPPPFRVEARDTLDAFFKVYKSAAGPSVKSAAGSNVSSVLICGETGTGKESLARYTHFISERKGEKFVAINCAAIPENLLESELFGYEKGAFTGAARQTPGKIETADKGTLFLDEIGDLPMALQAKLLRFLQERVIERLGGRQEIQVDVQVVCATHRNLVAQVQAGEFRADLYYRLAETVVTIPPLRERSEDIEAIAVATLKVCGVEGSLLTPGARNLLKKLPYPGNARALVFLMKLLAREGGNNKTIDEGMVCDAVASRPDIWPTSENKQPTEHQIPQENSGSDMLMLNDFVNFICHVSVDKDDSTLQGIMPKLDAAMSNLKKLLLGAALEKCRDPNRGSFIIQKTARFLTGNDEMNGTNSRREINTILGKKQSDSIVNHELEELVDKWRESKKNCHL